LKSTILMEHVLDNPVWNALLSGNINLALGNAQVKYFDPLVSPFVGFKEVSKDSFKELYELIDHNKPLLFVTPHQIEIPQIWNVTNVINGYQMIWEGEAAQYISTAEILPLDTTHTQQMVDLTKLTKPGPFAERTIEFGHYHGIFEGDKLIAMAGQRLYPFNYAEISAVCTHPDHLGKGYAKQLLLYHIHRIKQAGETPFLHVWDGNDRAIQVYQNLGFITRTPVQFHVLAKR
jgi:ribosomal protein S18 acetylase RimI-like enzyme